MKLKLFLVTLSIFLFFSCKNQDENKNEIINKIHTRIKTSKNDSTLILLDYSRDLIKNNKNINDSIKAENNFLFGEYYSAIKNTETAYKFYNKAISFSLSEVTSEREKKYFNTLTLFYKKNSDYLNSLSVLDKLEKNTPLKDYKTFAEINNQKQSIYKLLKNYKKAIFYNRKVAEYYALDKDTSRLINTLILRANLNYYNFKNKKEAYRLLDSIIKIDFQSNNYHNILKNKVYQSYGIFNYYDGDYKNSHKNYYKALSYLKNPQTLDDSLSLANSYANISEVCMDLKKYKSAKKYNDSVALLSNVLTLNLKNFHLQNKLRFSYETKSSFSKISRDLSIINHNMNTNYEKRINHELAALKDANKKEKELLVANQKVSLNNANLKRKQILLFSFLGLLILSGLVTFLFYRQKQLKQEKEEIFMQQRLFRAQMNPHFTSNILFTIQDLILENKEKANKYLIKFSRLLRLNLENSMQNFTLIEKEMEVLSKYLDLQQLRFPDKFDYKINTNNLEIDLLSIPPMLIQPFVENAIEHGFKNIDYKGLITINLSEKENFIHCEIIDNGQGLQTKNSKKEHVSASTKLIRKLLKNMSNQKVIIQNNKNKKGTIVKFNIPFKE